MAADSQAASPVALVTGAGSGIGRATALALATAGYRVVAGDIDLGAAESTVSHILAQGHHAVAHATDVTRDASCEDLVTLALDHYGRLDAAFNNAGIAGHPARVGELSLAQWRRVLDVNLDGVFHCMRHELLAMSRAGTGGAIVNTSSIMGLAAVPGGSAYCAAKHAVIGLTQAAALEYGHEGIRVNAVCPGYIETPMTQGSASIFPEKQLQAAVQRAALRRLARPDEVAQMVVWLCSAQASFVTGASLTVDGGVSARA